MEKAQVTTELIGLRGGLSLLSKYTDDIKAQENAVEDEHLRLEELERKRDELKESIAEDKRKCEEKSVQCEHVKENLNNEKAEGYKAKVLEKSSDEASSVSGYFGCFTTILGFIAAIVSVCMFEEYETEIFRTIGVELPLWGIILSYIFLFFAVLGIGPLGWGISYKIIRWVKYRSRIGQAKIAFNEKIQDMESLLREREAELEELTAIHKARVEEYEENERTIETQKMRVSEIEASAEKEIASIAMNSQTLTAALADTYGFVISQSDWCNVDMIVHYLETGRADTIKEALQQVDQQRQTDQIARAITMASEAMQDHIESAFTRMGQALAEGFNRLDRSIQSVSRSIWSSQRDMIRSNEELRLQLTQKLEQQIDVSEMQNVLLEKSNKTSDDLLNDLRYNQRFWVK